MLRDEIRVLRRNCESDELAPNESKEILAELKEKIKDLREFADKLSDAYADEWEKQQEVITDKLKNCVNCSNYSSFDDISGITIYTCNLRDDDVIGQPECPCDKWRAVE